MSKYASKKQNKINEKRRALEAEEEERKREEIIKYMPNKTPHKVTACVRDVYRRVVDNGYVQQGITAHETTTFERENPLARGGHGTYAIHEYGGTQLIVELYVPGKQPFFVNVRARVLEMNQLVRINDSKIEILKQNNRDKKLIVTIVDTISKYHGALVDENEAIIALNLICR